MYFPRLIIVLFLGLQLATHHVSTMYQEKSLLCCKVTSPTEIHMMSIALFYQENRSNPYKMSPRASLQQLLLIMSGTVEINPGPGKPKFPCGECKKSVKNSEKSIACDICNQWHHVGCVSMGEQMFDCFADNENLEWICSKCALRDISDNLFDTSISSNESLVASPG